MENNDKLDMQIIEIIEQEMIALWATDELPHLLKKDEEFVKILTEGIWMEKSFWSKYMVVGEA